MREIKFRAWDYRTKAMWAVEDLSWCDPCFIVANPGLEHMDIQDRDFRTKRCPGDIELMQYTGLKDKNGKEIYEGDIVAIRREDDKEWKTGDCERAVIEYYDNYGAFVLEIYTVFGGEGYESLVGGEAGKYYRDRIEVIGNIYSNPELLESK